MQDIILAVTSTHFFYLGLLSHSQRLTLYLLIEDAMQTIP